MKGKIIKSIRYRLPILLPLLVLLACGGGGTGTGGTSDVAPAITSFFPATLRAGQGFPVIDVYGKNFEEGSQVHIGGTCRPTSYISPTRLKATLNNIDAESPGTVAVTVVNDSPMSAGTCGNESTTPSAPASFTVTSADYSVSLVKVTNAIQLISDTKNGLLYFATPPNPYSGAATIGVLDPVTGTVTYIPNPLSGPQQYKLAISDDSQFLYAYVNNVVQRFLLPSMTADIQFQTAIEIADLKVAPGAPHTIAVSFQNGDNGASAGVLIYDDATARPHNPQGVSPRYYMDQLAWGRDATVLYGHNLTTVGDYDIYVMSVDATGASVIADQANLNHIVNGLLNYDATSDLLYLGNGGGSTIGIDPSTFAQVSNIPTLCDPLFNAERSRMFCASEFPDFEHQDEVITAVDPATHRLLESISIPLSGGFGTPVLWGTEGLAFNTDNGIYLISGAFVSGSSAVTQTSDTPNVSTISDNQLTEMDLLSMDMVWDAAHKLFYLSVPGTSALYGNSVVALDPAAAKVVSSQPVASDPDKLAISVDYTLLYAGVDGAASVQRLTLPGLAPDIEFPIYYDPAIGPCYALGLAVAPDSPHTLAAATGYIAQGSYYPMAVTINDDKVIRPTIIGGEGYSALDVEWGASDSALYETGHIGYLLVASVNSSGVTPTPGYPGLGVFDGLHYVASSGLMYVDDGEVIVPTTGAVQATFPASGWMVPDVSLNKAFFIWQTQAQQFTPDMTLSSYNLKTQQPIDSMVLPGMNLHQPYKLMRWGSDGLAFPTQDGEVYLLRGGFVNG